MTEVPILILSFVGLSTGLLIVGTSRAIRDARRSRNEARHRIAVVYGLPGGLDMIALQMGAGVTVLHALKHIAHHFSDQPIAFEFAQIVRQHRAGASLTEAFEDFQVRCNHPQVTLFTRVIVQAHTQGGAVVQLLNEQADNFRLMIAEDVEKRAQELPVKLLMPLVIFIFPATLLPVIAVLIGKLWWQ
ncbi:type II secretion system F family protein [Aliidiomarina sanyensis]|nr:type II secretion system F family protein [Aliidiomarina sanyensis]